MNISYRGKFVLNDNDFDILVNIVSIIEYSDPEADISLDMKSDELICYIKPSDPNFRQELINNLLWINKFLKLKIQYSKSLKISKGVWFSIKL